MRETRLDRARETYVEVLIQADYAESEKTLHTAEAEAQVTTTEAHASL